MEVAVAGVHFLTKYLIDHSQLLDQIPTRNLISGYTVMIVLAIPKTSKISSLFPALVVGVTKLQNSSIWHFSLFEIVWTSIMTITIGIII